MPWPAFCNSNMEILSKDKSPGMSFNQDNANTPASKVTR